MLISGRFLIEGCLLNSRDLNRIEGYQLGVMDVVSLGPP